MANQCTNSSLSHSRDILWGLKTMPLSGTVRRP